MPKKPGLTTSREVTVSKVTPAETPGSFAVKVGAKLALSANFQTVTIEAGLEHTCRDHEQGFARAWDIINAELASQVGDAKETLIALTKVRGEVERGR